MAIAATMSSEFSDDDMDTSATKCKTQERKRVSRPSEPRRAELKSGGAQKKARARGDLRDSGRGGDECDFDEEEMFNTLNFSTDSMGLPLPPQQNERDAKQVPETSNVSAANAQLQVNESDSGFDDSDDEIDGNSSAVLTTNPTPAATMEASQHVKTWIGKPYSVDCLMLAVLRIVTRTYWPDVQLMAEFDCNSLAALIRRNMQKFSCFSNVPPPMLSVFDANPLENAPSVSVRLGEIKYLMYAVVQLTPTQVLPAFVGIDRLPNNEIRVYMHVYSVNQHDVEWHANDSDEGLRMNCLLNYEGDDQLACTLRYHQRTVKQCTLLEARDIDPTRKYPNPFTCRRVEGFVPFLRLRCADDEEMQSLRTLAAKRPDLFDIKWIERISGRKETLTVDLTSLLISLHNSGEPVSFVTELFSETFEDVFREVASTSGNDLIVNELIRKVCVDVNSLDVFLALGALLLWGSVSQDDEVVSSITYDDDSEETSSIPAETCVLYPFAKDELVQTSSEMLGLIQDGPVERSCSFVRDSSFGTLAVTVHGELPSVFDQLFPGHDFTKRYEKLVHILVFDEDDTFEWLPAKNEQLIPIQEATFCSWLCHQNVVYVTRSRTITNTSYSVSEHQRRKLATHWKCHEDDPTSLPPFEFAHGHFPLVL